MMLDFWGKWTHYLANQFLVIILFLNMYPGRCGGWELMAKADMMAQLAGDLILKNILVFGKAQGCQCLWASEEIDSKLLYRSLKVVQPAASWRFFILYSCPFQWYGHGFHFPHPFSCLHHPWPPWSLPKYRFSEEALPHLCFF